MFSFLILFFFQSAKAETSYLFENYLSYTSNVISDSTLNPDNQVFQLPLGVLAADIRGELKWKGESTQVVIRPRYVAEKEKTVAAGVSNEKNESAWNITDAFVEQYLVPELAVTAGLQVYQWGPAELMNPSDPIFHFNNHQKNFGYKEKGKALLRLNYSEGRTHNIVLLVEPVSNNESQWITGQEFVPKALLKYEYQNDDGSSILGFIGGREERESYFVGSYFSVPVLEGWSFYADAKANDKQTNFVPEQNGIFNDLEDPAEKKNWPVLAVTGVRWEGSFDLRIEYLFNSAGYSEQDIKSAFASISIPVNPNYLQNLDRFQRPGLDLLGQRYLYFSYRVSEPFEKKDLNLYLRNLYSLQDFSSQTQFEFDKAATDNLVVYGNLTGAAGRKETEFKILNDWQTLVGIKWVM